MKRFIMIVLVVGCFCLAGCGKADNRIKETPTTATVQSKQKCVEITTEATETPDTGVDDDEAYLLATLAMAEAEGEDLEGKALVIRVALNRVESDSFPDNIHDVIYQPHQFSPVSNGRFDRVEANHDCYEAYELVMSGWDESEGALYFESKSDSTWHQEHLKYLFKHGNHYFYTE